MDVTTSSLNWEWYNQLYSVTQASKLYNWGSLLNIWIPYAEMSQNLSVLALAGPFWPAVGCSAPPLLLSFLSTATSALSCCCGQRTQCRWGSPVSVTLWEGATAGWGSGKCYTAAAAGLADGEPVISAYPLLSPVSTMGPVFAPSLFFLTSTAPFSIFSQSPNIMFILLTSKTCHLMLLTGFCRFSRPCEQGHKIKKLQLKGSWCVVSLDPMGQ